MVYAVVVTFNRRHLLERCLDAIARQSRPPERVLVIDNASTDETQLWMQSERLTGNQSIVYVRMGQNLGGAGGFAEGMRRAYDEGGEWIWMMDDDAEPEEDALEQLLCIATETGNVYGSLAICGQDTAWPTAFRDGGVANRVAEVPERARVQFLPFLGFMIHTSLVDRIGLPDAGFFIAADDVEYCLRAERVGAQIIVAGKSRIAHPKSDRYIATLRGRQLICLRLPPWKRYYDTRNRLLIARKYYGFRLFTQTIPGSFVRLFAALWYEPRKWVQLWAFFAGFDDGALGLKGARHSLWRITP